MAGWRTLWREVADGLALTPRLGMHPRLWEVARQHGEDGDLDARAAQALTSLPASFYMPEKQLFTHPKLKRLVLEAGEDEVRLRLELLALRGLIEVKKDLDLWMYRLVRKSEVRSIGMRFFGKRE